MRTEAKSSVEFLAGECRSLAVSDGCAVESHGMFHVEPSRVDEEKFEVSWKRPLLDGPRFGAKCTGSWI